MNLHWQNIYREHCCPMWRNGSNPSVFAPVFTTEECVSSAECWVLIRQHLGDLPAQMGLWVGRLLRSDSLLIWRHMQSRRSFGAGMWQYGVWLDPPEREADVPSWAPVSSVRVFMLMRVFMLIRFSKEGSLDIWADMLGAIAASSVPDRLQPKLMRLFYSLHLERGKIMIYNGSFCHETVGGIFFTCLKLLALGILSSRNFLSQCLGICPVRGGLQLSPTQLLKAEIPFQVIAASSTLYNFPTWALQPLLWILTS